MAGDLVDALGLPLAVGGAQAVGDVALVGRLASGGQRPRDALAQTADQVVGERLRPLPRRQVAGRAVPVQGGAGRGRLGKGPEGGLAVAGRLVGGRRKGVLDTGSTAALSEAVEDLVLLVLEHTLEPAHEVGRHRLEGRVSTLEQEPVAVGKGGLLGAGLFGRLRRNVATHCYVVGDRALGRRRFDGGLCGLLLLGQHLLGLAHRALALGPETGKQVVDLMALGGRRRLVLGRRLGGCHVHLRHRPDDAHTLVLVGGLEAHERRPGRLGGLGLGRLGKGPGVGLGLRRFVARLGSRLRFGRRLRGYGRRLGRRGRRLLDAAGRHSRQVGVVRGRGDDAPVGGLGRDPGLVFGVSELGGDVVERAPHGLVGLEQPVAPGQQLLDLDLGGPPAAGEITDDALPHDLGFGDHLPAAGFGGVELGLHAVVDGLGVGLCRGPDVGRHLVGFLDAAGEHVLGFEPQAGALFVGLLDHARHALFGLRAHVGRRLARAAQDAHRLLAESGRERGLIELRMGEGAARLLESLAQLLLPLARRDQLVAHLLQIAADLILVEATEDDRERAPGDVVGRDAGLGRDDDAIVRHVVAA